MAVISNSELLKLAKSDTTYQKWTADKTDDIFTTKGFEAFSMSGRTEVEGFLNLLVRVYLQKIKTPEVRIPKIWEKVVERYTHEMGGIAQRMRTHLVKPTDPKYVNLVENGSVDPFVIRKDKVDQEFYTDNFNYANNITKQYDQLRKAFLDEAGLVSLIDKMMYGFNVAKDIQEYETIRNMVHLIQGDSITTPLKSTQKIEVPDIMDSGADNGDMQQWLQVFRNFYSLFEATVVSGEFNAKSYEAGIVPSEHVLFVRAEILNKLRTTLLATTYHIENLNTKFEVVGVKDFGGITYKKGNTEMKPVYSTAKGNEGQMLGYNASGLDTDPIEKMEDLTLVDPHANTQALLIQKGAIFIDDQMPYEVASIYNPAGRYTNFWASQPQRTIGYDGSYNVIQFNNPSA